MKLNLIYTIAGLFIVLSTSSCQVETPSEITALQEQLALETASQNNSTTNTSSTEGQENESESNENEESNELNESSETSSVSEINESNEGVESSNETTNSENSSSISDSVTQSISSYVSSNYTGQTIVDIDVESTHIEVELSNGLDLIFDTNGNFLRLDD